MAPTKSVKISSARPLDMPVAEWIAALHADLDVKIAAAEAKLATKPKTETDSEAPKTPKKTPKAKVAPDAPKKAPKSETVVEAEKRIKRMSPTLTKQLTSVFGDAKKEFKKENGVEFAKYVNDLSKEAFEAKNLSDHMRDFVGAGPVAPVAETKPEPKKVVKKETPIPEAVPDEDMIEVPFKGVKYVVGEISKRVYEANDDADKFVGLLGLGKFKTMQLPA